VQWWRYARIGVACVLLAWLLKTQVLKPEFFSAFAGVRLPFVAIAFVFSVLSVVTKARRWAVILHARGMGASNWYLFISYLIGMFFNNFLPSGMGGDAVRAFDSARTTGRGKEAVTAVILERGTGMITVFGCGSILALFQPNLPLQIALVAHGLFIGTLVIFFLLWQDFTGGILNWIGIQLVARFFGGRLSVLWAKIVSVYEEFRSYRHQWRLLGAVLLQSALTQVMTVISIYTLILAFDYQPPFGAFIAVTGIATALDLVPISLNGLGIREGVYVYFLGLLAIPGPVAVAFALLNRLIVLVQALIGGVAFLWRSARPSPLPTTATQHGEISALANKTSPRNPLSEFGEGAGGEILGVEELHSS
jgi:uncharacterized protein (TIRG00374 family)